MDFASNVVITISSIQTVLVHNVQVILLIVSKIKLIRLIAKLATISILVC